MRNKLILSLTIVCAILLSVITINISASSEEIATKTQNITKNENIVFLGDSIFDWYPTDKIFNDLPVVNSGICGNKTTDILENMEERVYKYNPTKVFLNIGTNDIEYEDSDELNEEVYQNIVKIADNIQRNRKRSKIYIVSIYPVNNNMDAAHERHNSEIEAINSKLRDYCNSKDGIEYIDAYSQLLDSEGMLDEVYTKDGLHPNDLGYAKLTEIFMKYMYQ